MCFACARSAYDLKSFRNDLKEVMRRAGVEGKPVLLLLGAWPVVGCLWLEWSEDIL